MISTIGYTNLTMNMTEEEQREALGKKVNKNMILSEKDKRRIVLSVLPEVLERGSIVYVASLSVLGDKAYRIKATLEKFSKNGIAIISLKENVNTLIENDWCTWMKKIGDVEIDSMYYHKQIKKDTERKGGRKKMIVTPEMREILIDYKRGKITLKEATQRLGCGNTTLYSLLEREKESMKEKLDEDRALKAKEVNDWLKRETEVNRAINAERVNVLVKQEMGG